MPEQQVLGVYTAVAIRSNTKSSQKPNKPYPSFPLTPHANGQWCKKIRGKMHFFGVWSDPDTALRRYHAVAADLHEGRSPWLSSVGTDDLTVKELGNAFLAWQEDKMDAHDIGPPWFEDCRRIIKDFAKSIGPGCAVEHLRPEEFR